MTGRMHRGWHACGRGPGRGGWQQADLPGADDAAAWFTGGFPTAGSPGAGGHRRPRGDPHRRTLPPREGEFAEGDAGRPSAPPRRTAGSPGSARTPATSASRSPAQAEHRFGRKVAWGARVGDDRALFTVASVPVMTRLRQPERLVLDTLVDAGVARSRSEALAWCVRLVGQHADDWLAELREAMAKVDDLRAKGPDGDPGTGTA